LIESRRRHRAVSGYELTTSYNHDIHATGLYRQSLGSREGCVGKESVALCLCLCMKNKLVTHLDKVLINRRGKKEGK
jgi:hypothetical protein